MQTKTDGAAKQPEGVALRFWKWAAQRLEKLSMDSGFLLGVLFAALCAMVLYSAVLSAPRLGGVDYGEYDDLLPTIGLSHTEETLRSEEGHYYRRVVETYEYTHFSYARLLTPAGTPSIAYPVALVRLFTHAFMPQFSTVSLAVLLIALLSAGIYLAVRWGYGFLRGGVCIPAGLLLVLFSDSGFSAYLNSLYPQGTMAACFLLFLGFLLRAFAPSRAHYPAQALPVLVFGILFVCAQAELMVFLPLVWVAAALVFFREGVKKTALAHTGLLACVLVLLWAGSFSAVKQLQSNRELVSYTADYHAVFSGLAKYSLNPSQDLNGLGLAESYLPDVGHSFYEADENYAHPPRAEAEEQFLSARITKGRIALQYLRHPNRMTTVLEGVFPYLASYENQRIVAVGMETGMVNKVVRHLPLGQTLRALVYPSAGWWQFLLPGAAGLACLLMLALPPKSKLRLFGALGASACLGLVVFLPFRILLAGDTNVDLSKVSFLYLEDMFLVVGLGALLFAADRLFAVLSVPAREIPLTPLVSARPVVTAIPPRLRSAAKIVLDSRKWTVALVMAAAVLMCLCLLLVPPRAGGVNNGDFGRMMNHLGLIWESDIFFVPDAQLGKRVIETYNYTGEFNWKTLTTLEPTYSLIYPAAIVRLSCTLLDQPFHTNYLSFVFVLAALACLLSILRDVYPCFGRYTLPLGLLLCGMLFGEAYLVWFNSLFGEGSIYLGILMLVAASVKLAVVPRGKGWPWLAFLCFACRFLLASKAQLIVAAPICLVLVGIFTIWHLPAKIWQRALCIAGSVLMCILFTVNGWAVYQKNDAVSSEATMWQSVFYGLLMVADDVDAAMEELGIDPTMKPDVGKDAYLEAEDYVYAPNSDEAKAGFYNQVDIIDVVGWYLRHPGKLIHMLNNAATQSTHLHDGFMAYVGQRYDEAHDPVDRFGFWQYLRPLFAGGSFWYYVVLYSALIALCVLRLRRSGDATEKLLTIGFLGVMLIGVLQFPLSMVGNGFADNNKQLFTFMLCHDFLIIFAGVELVRAAVGKIRQIRLVRA